MMEEVSALFDGELDDAAANRAAERLLGDATTIDAWQVFALIGDAMRGEEVVAKGGATARFHDRLAGEPTVLCRVVAKRRNSTGKPVIFAAAASVAGVAVVLWAALGMRMERSVDLARVESATTTRMAAVRAGGNSGTEEFLLAHQAVSPSGALSGFSHYARTVALASGQGSGRR